MQLSAIPVWRPGLQLVIHPKVGMFRKGILTTDIIGFLGDGEEDSVRTSWSLFEEVSWLMHA